MKRAALALAGALLASGCAHDRVTLLDNEEGAEQFAVADITDPARERLIAAPATELKLGTRAKPRTLSKLRKSDTALAQNLPPKAAIFRITFPIDQTEIPAAQRGVLERIRNEVSVRPGAQIEVAGFTDSTGPDAMNDDISRKRAEAVAEQLRAFGFAVDPGDAVGRGEDEARKALGDEKASEDFRRVDVIVR